MASGTTARHDLGANPVLLLLLTVMLAAVLGTAFLGLAPNRIVSAKPLMLWEVSPALAAGFAVCWCVLLGVALWPWMSQAPINPPPPCGEGLGVGVRSILEAQQHTDALHHQTPTPDPSPQGGGGKITISGLLPFLALISASALILLNLYTAGSTATALIKTTIGTSARVSVGAAFWIVLLCGSLALSDTFSRYRLGPGWRFGVPTVLITIVAIMLASELFNNLSILREWSNRRDSFSEAVLRHATLVISALMLALPIGAMLGLIVLRNPSRGTAVFAVLNLIQTIPSIALFGLLIGPLTALSDAMPFLRDIGLRGIGFAPALIALVLYSLLPVARTVHAGFSGVAEDVRDAARGMGLTDRQILWQVSFPLATPVLLAGLRIVTIQLIGLAVVAALIGAGGLGAFVFQGLAQTATDLVLLGAMTAIALALLTDAVLRASIAFLRRGIPA